MDEPLPQPRTNVQEFSVSELSQLLKRSVEETFPHVRIRGEISGFKRAASGHLYFDMKDENACLNAVCWRGTAGGFKVQPEDGMEVVVTGRLSTYPGRSSYQVVVERLEPAGVGALMALLEARKKQLAAEGLFDEARKKPIPFMPRVVGVVTSPTGAVIRDILHRIADRFPLHVLVWPVLVQGEGAKEQIAAAIEGFNALPEAGAIPVPEVLIVARGGGSFEDLWAFNEEIVVRAAAASRIPLISAVGHETDTTLIDHASDRRAPTPTAAAEMAVPVRAELQAYTMVLSERLFTSTQRTLVSKEQYLTALACGLISPRQLLENMGQRLDDWSERLATSYQRLLEKRSEHIASLGRLLESYHYKKVLARGFALVRDEVGGLVASAARLKPGMRVRLEFADGAAEAAIAGTSGEENEKAPLKKAARKKTPPSPANQGSLF
jgi:exodeoxyribonuclease VII large subunit